MIEKDNDKISVYRQCELLGLSRSTAYYLSRRDPARVEFERLLLHAIDRLYTEHPHLGRPKMTASLRRAGYVVNPKRIDRLMKKLGIQAIYPKPRSNTSQPNKQHKKYPYLLRNVDISAPDEVWCSDITYIPLYRGFAYLVAVMDWNSRYVLSWELSNTMDASFCVDALRSALSSGRLPAIFNTDQGSQFTSEAFINELIGSDINISMDGKGRAFDNIMIERLWRTVKYENVYMKDYETPAEARYGLSVYFDYYNYHRPHSSLGEQTPGEKYGAIKSKELLTSSVSCVNMESVMAFDSGAVERGAHFAPVALRAPSAKRAPIGLSKDLLEDITP